MLSEHAFHNAFLTKSLLDIFSLWEHIFDNAYLSKRQLAVVCFGSTWFGLLVVVPECDFLSLHETLATI